ncbi:MAG TPA: histidine-type phosphatase [Terracidiphilus sp.]
MNLRAGPQLLFLCGVSFLTLCPPLAAQALATPSAAPKANLQLVIVLSRHGVRSPLNLQADLDKYSAAHWPKWDVAPGILTNHGYDLIKIFGAWDRVKFSGEGLLAPTGCADAGHVTIVADTDQRTRQTGKALAEGMFPGCGISIHSQPDGTTDPLFLPSKAGIGHPDPALVTAAVAGRIGGNPTNLTETYRPQLAALDRILSGCGRLPPNPQRISIFDIPAGLKPGTEDSPVAARGPLVTASTLIENLLLEYTEGMSTADTGWGCVDGATLRFIMQANVAAWNYDVRTPAFARTYASNLLAHIRTTMEQSVKGTPIRGAIGKPDDRMLILVGHDSDIAAVAGALGIDWIADGRADDTPPGGALLFQLWRSPRGASFVRVEFITQTLEQMRNSVPLTPANPPAEAPIFVPACSGADLSCTWESFSAAMRQATDPAFVTTLR